MQCAVSVYFFLSQSVLVSQMSVAGGMHNMRCDDVQRYKQCNKDTKCA
jgi:hypothetical protein